MWLRLKIENLYFFFVFKLFGLYLRKCESLFIQDLLLLIATKLYLFRNRSQRIGIACKATTCDTSLPFGCQFKFQLLHLKSSSLLMHGKNSGEWPVCLSLWHPKGKPRWILVSSWFKPCLCSRLWSRSTDGSRSVSISLSVTDFKRNKYLKIEAGHKLEVVLSHERPELWPQASEVGSCHTSKFKFSSLFQPNQVSWNENS